MKKLCLHWPCAMYLDSVLDDLKVYAQALSPQEIEEEYAKVGEVKEPPPQKHGLPSLPEDLDRFGAYYTTLKYYKEWDRLVHSQSSFDNLSFCAKL